MTKIARPLCGWRTSSLGDAPDTSARELADLGTHLRRCRPRNAPLFAFKCAGDALNDFAAPRTVTIIALFAVMSVFAALLF